jgi:hypothetical protein
MQVPAGPLQRVDRVLDDRVGERADADDPDPLRGQLPADADRVELALDVGRVETFCCC